MTVHAQEHNFIKPQFIISPLYTRNPKTGTLSKSQDLDEIPHEAVFHQGLHCLLNNRQGKTNYIIIWKPKPVTPLY